MSEPASFDGPELALRKLMQQMAAELESHEADKRALAASERKSDELCEVRFANKLRAADARA